MGITTNSNEEVKNSDDNGPSPDADASASGPQAPAPQVVIPATPVDRFWLKKLIQKHSDDERLVPYYKTLHAKYPILKDKALVVAPMVDQSDLPFRILCRNYNANLCFTPMVHAKMYHQKISYRRKFWSHTNGTPKEDRPLIVQLCGSDKEHLLYTIKDIIHSAGGVDGIDLNCGCPQTIAKRGVYGAFLLEKDNGNLIVDVVKYLVEQVGHLIPISVKVRILPSGVEDSLKLYGRLVDAGASMLTIHGRTRLQKGLKTGKSDWDAIRRVVQLYGGPNGIPIVANGGISNLDDVRECLEHTGVDGIMSSEGILEYPPLFTETGTEAVQNQRTGPGRVQITREFLDICQTYPPEEGGQGNGIKCVRAHVHRYLHEDLKGRNDVRKMIAFAQDLETLHKACDEIQKMHDDQNHVVAKEEELSWYMRHRVVVKSADGTTTMTALEKKLAKNREVNQFTEEQLEEIKDGERAGSVAHIFGCTIDDDDGDGNDGNGNGGCNGNGDGRQCW
jgi:tRNA-dihydrouridine synthase 1